jgi:hypothetical protein
LIISDAARCDFVGERAVQDKINLILTDLIGNNLIYYFEKPDRELRKRLFLNRQSEKLKAVWKKRGPARRQSPSGYFLFILLYFGMVALQ